MLPVRRPERRKSAWSNHGAGGPIRPRVRCEDTDSFRWRFTPSLGNAEPPLESRP